MKKQRLDKDIITILISTLITLVVWVGVEVYHAYAQLDVPPGVDKHLQPMDTSLNTGVFDKLKERQP
jgi:hypothetical protein